MNEPRIIDELVRAKTIAVVGLSEDAGKPSHYVSAYMQARGARILPVNPGLTSVLGERCFSSLTALPLRPDLVNVFRLPRFIDAIVEEMMALGLDALWVQQGIVNLAAAEKAEAAGMRVVMDRCIMVERRRGA